MTRGAACQKRNQGNKQTEHGDQRARDALRECPTCVVDGAAHARNALLVGFALIDQLWAVHVPTFGKAFEPWALRRRDEETGLDSPQGVLLVDRSNLRRRIVNHCLLAYLVQFVDLNLF